MGDTKSALRAGALAAAFTIAAAGCGSDSDGETTTATAGQEMRLPAAEGRTGFAVSDTAAVVGGGGGKDSEGRYAPTARVWRLNADGEASELPKLPTDEFVQGLSGVEVDGRLVLGAMDCNGTAIGVVEADFLHCSAPRRPVLWSTDVTSPQDWETHPLPDELASVFDFPDDLPTGGVDLRVFGSHGNEVYLALTGGAATRFAVFRPSDATFRVLADGPATASGWGTHPFCVDKAGRVLQASSGSASAGTDRIINQDDVAGNGVKIARLDAASGKWSEGPALAGITQIIDIECSDGQLFASVFATEGAPALGEGDADTLQVRVLEGSKGSPGASAPQLAGEIGSGRILVEGAGIGTDVQEHEMLTSRSDVSVSDSESVFTFGDRIGVVDNRTGVLRVY